MSTVGWNDPGRPNDFREPENEPKPELNSVTNGSSADCWFNSREHSAKPLTFLRLTSWLSIRPEWWKLKSTISCEFRKLILNRKASRNWWTVFVKRCSLSTIFQMWARKAIQIYELNEAKWKPLMKSRWRTESKRNGIEMNQNRSSLLLCRRQCAAFS